LAQNCISPRVSDRKDEAIDSAARIRRSGFGLGFAVRALLRGKKGEEEGCELMRGEVGGVGVLGERAASSRVQVRRKKPERESRMQAARARVGRGRFARRR